MKPCLKKEKETKPSGKIKKKAKLTIKEKRRQKKDKPDTGFQSSVLIRIKDRGWLSSAADRDRSWLGGNLQDLDLPSSGFPARSTNISIIGQLKL